MNKAIFLDRDGTIIEEVNYLSSFSDIKVFDFAFESVKIFNQLNFKVFIVTNQSGVARGFFSEKFVIETNNFIIDLFKKNGASIDSFFYCPHHPDDNCSCRKPQIGMLKEAKEKFNIDFSKSYIIGDSYADFMAGVNANIFSILVLTGHGKNFINSETFIVENLYSAALLIKNLTK